MDHITKARRYADLLSRPEKHGRLTGCTYSLHDGGTAKNSDSFIYLSVQFRDGGQLITLERKEAFGGKTVQVCRPKSDVLGLVSEFIGKYNFAALADLEEDDELTARNGSTHSEDATLFFDDTLLGSCTSVSRSISFTTVRQCGGEAMCDKYAKLLFAAVCGSELISERTTDGSPEVFFERL